MGGIVSLSTDELGQAHLYSASGASPLDRDNHIAKEIPRQFWYNVFSILPAPNSAKEMLERIPPAFLPRPILRAGKTLAEVGRIHIPRKLFRPAEFFLNRLDFARNTFELCPADTAKKN